jgi:CheY-like chemotaxis protein
MAAVPRVLVVEDDPHYMANVIESVFGAVPTELRAIVGGRRLPYEHARWLLEARDFLRIASARYSLPDVVVLDLGLPETESEYGQTAETTNGWRLLDQITQVYDIPAVILTSNPDDIPDPIILLEALQHGAADFVNKDDLTRDSPDFLYRLISVVGKHREQLHRKEAEKRFRRLQDFRAKKQRERLATTISRHVEEIADVVDRVSKRLSQQFGLDPGRHTEDPVVTGLMSIREAASRVGDVGWESPAEDVAEPELTKLDVGQIVSDKIAHTRPCFYRRNVELDWTPPEREFFLTESFESELADMIAELVFGTLEAVADEPTSPVSSTPRPERAVRFELKATEQDILLMATRSGEGIEPEVVKQLNDGIAENEEPWQGLFYLQSIGGDIGVGVELESTKDGTSITLQIPVVTGAEDE